MRLSVCLATLSVVVAALSCAPMPEPVPAVCEAVDCGAGRCVEYQGAAECVCNAGHEPRGLSCVAVNTDACAGNPCAPTGKVCADVQGVAVCNCPDGFVEGAGGCVAEDPCRPNPCGAPNQTTCIAQALTATCVCNPGFAPLDDGTCSADPLWDCARAHSGGSGDDVYEADECPTLAKPLDLGGAQAHTVFPAGDEDWFTLPPGAGRVTEIVIVGTDGIPLYADVFLADGVTAIAADHRGLASPRFSFLATEQQLLLRIKALRTNDTGGYTVTAHDLGGDDYSNTAKAAISLSAGGTFTGALQYDGDEDWVSISASARRAYTLSLPATMTAAVAVEVYEADGTTLRKRMDMSLTENTKHVVWRATASKFYLRALSRQTSGSEAFSVNITDEGMDDFGDTLGDATLVTPQVALRRGYFERADDVDVVSFNVQAGHIYKVSCRQQYYGCGLVMRDSSGATQGQTSNSEGTAVVATQDETWTLSLSAPQYASTFPLTYDFSVGDLGVDDHGNDLTNATQVTVGTARSGRLEMSSDNDMFKFTGAANRIYEVRCTAQSPLSDCSVRAYDGSGLLQGSSQSYPYNVVAFEAPAAGTYYAEVRTNSYSGSGPYSVVVVDKGLDDHGDGAATATALTLETAQSGTVEYAGDRDAFSFQAQAAHIYRVTCATNSAGCPMTVTDSAGVTVANNNYYSSTSLSFRATSGGTFNVVTGPSSTVGGYWITVNDLGLDDHSDTNTGTTPLTVGTPLSGVLNFPNDKDVFSFNATATRIYKVTCTPSGTSSSCSIVVKNSSDAIVSQESNSNQGVLTATFEAAATGTLFVTIAESYYASRGTTSYTVNVIDDGVDDHGDTAADATPLTPAAAASARLDYAGDIDVFSFSTTADRIYRVTCTSSTYAACAMTIKDGNGVAVANTSSSTSSATSFLATATGTFTVAFSSGYSSSNGGVQPTYTYRLFDDGVDDHGNTRADATPLTIGTAQSGSSQYVSDVDVFSFSATAGRGYLFSCAGSSSYGCQMIIRNAVGAQLGNSYSGTQTYASFEAATSGTFTVEVSGPTYNLASPLAYTLSSSEFTDDHGDTWNTATAVTIGTPTQGVLETSSDEDFFSVTSTAGQVRSVTVSASAWHYVHVFDRSGVTRIASGYTGSAISFSTPTTGDYFVKVYGSSSSNGPGASYSVSIQ